MSDDILECDACGQRVKKFHRRYRNIRYCQSCYVFLFRKVMCPECGDLARLHTEYPLSVCNKCEKAKPCVRCGRKGYRLGKLTIYGPVCNACSYWFRENRPCSRCGKLSRLLSHSSRSGYGGQICPTCVRIEHRCCSACGRYRELVKSSDGRAVCKRCLELGEIKCANCGAMMPAGYGKTCEECHWRAIFSKHRVTNLALFQDSIIASEYDAFCGWLGNRQSYRKCGTLSDRYCLPFLRLENTSKQHADWYTLFRRFSPGEMRKYPLLERWLREREPELSLNMTKQVSAEEHYIKNILARGDCLEARDVMRQYAGLLEQRRAGGTEYRTVRMALSTAVALLEFSIRSDNGVPVQRDVVRYLRQKPGQRANLSGFIRFLNIIFNSGLTLPPMKTSHSRKSQLEKSLMALMVKAEAFNETLWVRTAIAYFHDIPLSQADYLLNNGILVRESRGFSLLIRDKNYWIPKPIFKIITG